MPDMDARMWGLLAHASAIVFPAGGPLVIWFIKKDDEFVAFCAIQAFYWSLITFVVTLVCTLVTCGAGSILLFFFWVGSLFVGLRAKEGEWYGYWFIDKIGLDGSFTP